MSQTDRVAEWIKVIEVVIAFLEQLAVFDQRNLVGSDRAGIDTNAALDRIQIGTVSELD